MISFLPHVCSVAGLSSRNNEAIREDDDVDGGEEERSSVSLISGGDFWKSDLLSFV